MSCFLRTSLLSEVGTKDLVLDLLGFTGEAWLLTTGFYIPQVLPFPTSEIFHHSTMVFLCRPENEVQLGGLIGVPPMSLMRWNQWWFHQ